MDNKTAIKIMLCEMVVKADDVKTQAEIETLISEIASRIVKLLVPPAVSNRKELLLAFHKFQQKKWSNPNAEISENVVDVFLSQQ